MPKKEFYHITLFHTSRYDWQTLDPFVARTIFRNLKPSEAPSPHTFGHEKSVINGTIIAFLYLIEFEFKFELEAIQDTKAPSLYLEKISLSDSGTLLALWVDKTPTIKRLRGNFKEKFPGAPDKQTDIIHTTLLRY